MGINLLMQMTLLQIVAADSLVNAAAQESVSVLDLLSKGGWTMIPILLLSIVAVYIFIERLLTLQRASKTTKNHFFDLINKMVLDGDVQGAKALCIQVNSPTAKMIEKGNQQIGEFIKKYRSQY